VENPVEKDLKSGEKEHLVVEKLPTKPGAKRSPALIHGYLRV